ncbi:hypothetical protein [Rhizobium etli]|uniref:hypothetical protein n=1 Tax=Rhizobium etli TaxID=29449 RepID=UPI0012BB4DDE|nr:hypothetical protein [Rhizobium etli]
MNIEPKRPVSLGRFRFSPKRRTALTFCSYAIPGEKPLRSFSGACVDRKLRGNPNRLNYKLTAIVLVVGLSGE